MRQRPGEMQRCDLANLDCLKHFEKLYSYNNTSQKYSSSVRSIVFIQNIYETIMNMLGGWLRVLYSAEVGKMPSQVGLPPR